MKYGPKFSSQLLDAIYMDSKIPLSTLQVDGGMTGNNLLMQLQADIVGIPVGKISCLLFVLFKLTDSSDHGGLANICGFMQLLTSTGEYSGLMGSPCARGDAPCLTFNNFTQIIKFNCENVLIMD